MRHEGVVGTVVNWSECVLFDGAVSTQLHCIIPVCQFEPNIETFHFSREGGNWTFMRFLLFLSVDN